MPFVLDQGRRPQGRLLFWGRTKPRSSSMASKSSPVIRAFFDEATSTVSYLVADPATRHAAVIDPVLDYDPKSGSVDVHSVETVLKAAADEKLTIDWVLETHAHADHLSASPYVK